MISENSLHKAVANVNRVKKFLRPLALMSLAYIAVIGVIFAFNVGQLDCMRDTAACAERVNSIKHQPVAWPW